MSNMRTPPDIPVGRHHTRHVSIDEDLSPEQSPWVSTQLYSLSQQLLIQDPLLYILNVCLREDHNPRLVWYPEPTFAVDANTKPVPITFHGAAMSQLTDSATRSPDHIRQMAAAGLAKTLSGLSVSDDIQPGCKAEKRSALHRCC